MGGRWGEPLQMHQHVVVIQGGSAIVHDQEASRLSLRGDHCSMVSTEAGSEGFGDIMNFQALRHGCRAEDGSMTNRWFRQNHLDSPYPDPVAIRIVCDPITA